ncbi:hypothetical protein ACFL5E_04315, partial [Candidatus Omnitrophota bacterium]
GRKSKEGRTEEEKKAAATHSSSGLVILWQFGEKDEYEKKWFFISSDNFYSNMFRVGTAQI